MAVSQMRRSSVSPTVVKFNDIDPRKLELNGDRYVVELEELDNIHEFGEGLQIELPQDAISEARVGWAFGRIIATGGRDILYRAGADQPSMRKCAHRLDKDEWVPIFFSVGQRVIVNRFAGEQVVFQGRRYRCVNQVDIIGSIREG